MSKLDERLDALTLRCTRLCQEARIRRLPLDEVLDITLTIDAIETELGVPTLREIRAAESTLTFIEERYL